MISGLLTVVVFMGVIFVLGLVLRFISRLLEMLLMWIGIGVFSRGRIWNVELAAQDAELMWKAAHLPGPAVAMLYGLAPAFVASSFYQYWVVNVSTSFAWIFILWNAAVILHIAARFFVTATYLNLLFAYAMAFLFWTGTPVSSILLFLPLVLFLTITFLFPESRKRTDTAAVSSQKTAIPPKNV
ncbi:hypothetical protein [Alkalicoccus urumqiensis]|uniref:Uncharacterized protein n=1 Tax=Alkalicoccus urumqiensis TaxID=1548213 RepID=A0A2P6MHW9_ALKUR|nr:hypothetical protein [Alkalicoccus urumqiensis]PRO65871.1 hypothetical protein C6I21_08220 [Alkalicoccus urumqiensis]